MANSSKDKGDRNEREAVKLLLDLAPDLAIPLAQRKLGAGRKEDVGDLHFFADAAVQVRAYAVSKLPDAIRSAAVDSVAQARNGLLPYALGMVPVPRALARQVRWLASVVTWPVRVEPDAVAVFGDPRRAVAHVRNEAIGVPRWRRIARVERTGKEPIWLAPIEAWLAAYREAHGLLRVAVLVPDTVAGVEALRSVS